MPQSKACYYEELELGDEIGPLSRSITDKSVADFCRVWGNHGPNRFTDEATAKGLGLDGPIVPGIMSMAIIAQFLTAISPEAALKHLDVVFRQPLPHRRVTLSAVVTDKREESGEHLIECDVYMSNEESGHLVGGKGIIALPSRNG